MKVGVAIRPKHVLAVVIAGCLCGCGDKPPEQPRAFQWKKPSESSLAQCVSLRPPQSGLTPLTVDEIKRTVVGHAVAFYNEGQSPNDVLADVVDPRGIYLQVMDNVRASSLYEIRGNCLCIGAPPQCARFYRDAKGRLRASLNGMRPFYVDTRAL